MPFFLWSKTASSNATADSSINWAEGQAPSSVNDSARAMMARAAEYRDDIAGAIVTGGTSTAYIVTSNQVFDTLAHMANQMIAFTPHTTSGTTVTLNVDGLGAKPLRSAPSTELFSGVLVQGTPYVAVYNNSDGAFYLKGFFGNPYNIMIGGLIPYMGSSAPNSAFVLPFGQAISRSTYATLFGIAGTTFGAGDGSTTFNVPDLRGTIPAGVDNMGGVSGGRFAGLNPGTFQGAITHTLSLSEIPTGITSSGSNSISVTSTGNVQNGSVAGNVASGANFGIASNINQITSTGTNTINVTSNNTLGNAHSIVQPTLGINYILRII